jgi:hypothetical protein
MASVAEKLAGLPRVRNTIEVKSLALHSVKRHLDADERPGKRSSYDIYEHVGVELGFDATTLRNWCADFCKTGEIAPDHRGGDHRSVDQKDKESSYDIYDIIVNYIADEHNGGRSVTARGMYQYFTHLPATTALFGAWFHNERAFYRYLHRNDIEWEKIDKYEVRRQEPGIVERRKYYVTFILKNQYLPYLFPLIFPIIIFLLIDVIGLN